jgi:CubicO group peptidase (beta-lactamase class C family)
MDDATKPVRNRQRFCTRDTITLANWRTRPYSFWSFRNVSEMVRSARIATSDPRALPAIARNQEALTKPAWPGAEQSTAELLARAQTDSIVVSRNAGILWEWHAPGVDRNDPHLVFSISKSIAALVAGILEDQGLLEPDATVAELVPEVRGSAYEDATIRNLLDMRVSLDFDESYLSEEALCTISARHGMESRRSETAARRPACSPSCAVSDMTAHPHGGDHAYLSPNSRHARYRSRTRKRRAFLGIVFNSSCGNLLAHRQTLSSPLTISARRALRAGSPYARMICSRWVRCCSRTAAHRQAKLFRKPGLRTCEHKATPGAWRRGSQAGFLKNGRYRSNWYQVGGDSSAYLAAGIHGQFLYCDPGHRYGRLYAHRRSTNRRTMRSIKRCWRCSPRSAMIGT